MAPGDDESTLTALVTAALDGDQDAWRRLVDRVKYVAWNRINAVGLPRADAEDAFAATIFRLYEHLGRIRDPERVPGWVATTARNEAISLLRSRQRLSPTDSFADEVGDVGDHDRRLVRDELRDAVRRSFERLGHECQQLLRLLTCEPPMSYQDISLALDIPVGSIGPTRQRCLDKLRAQGPLATYLTRRSS